MERFTAEQQAVVDRAQAAIDAFERALVGAGFTPQSAREYLVRFGGDASVLRAQKQADEVLRGIDEQVAREKFHAAPDAPVPRGIFRHGRV